MPMTAESIKIFHHLPKCGGTAMRNALGQWFTLVMDYISVDQLKGSVPINPPLELASLTADQCLCSHFETPRNHVFTRYPQLLDRSTPHQLFSLVRDPLELRISLYYYEIKTGSRTPERESLSDYLKTGNNYMSRRFPCTKDDFSTVLDRYAFIGVQEHLQDSLDYLGRLFDKPRVELQVVNVSHRDEQLKGLSDADWTRFRQDNALDYLIYEYAKARFWSCLKAAGQA